MSDRFPVHNPDGSRVPLGERGERVGPMAEFQKLRAIPMVDTGTLTAGWGRSFGLREKGSAIRLSFHG
jgi:hypothetical protein